jgi:hypothetical protein
MERLAYSSTEAFLAHYRLLSNAVAEGPGIRPPSVHDRQTLAAMQELMQALAPQERDILTDRATGNEKSGAERRLRERIRLKLSALLSSRGIVQ